MNPTKLYQVACILICLSLGFLGCHTQKTQWVEHDGFRLEIPADLELTDQLAEGLSCQYHNYYRELYLLGQAQSWADLRAQNPEASLQSIYEFHLDNLVLGLQEPNLPEPDSVQIDSLPALWGEIEGMYKGDMIHYEIALIQGDSQLYQLLLWTINAKLKENEAAMEQVIQSFTLPSMNLSKNQPKTAEGQ